MRAFITGATGLVGSHLTEQLVAQGHTVRALARTSSDTSFLRTLDVEIVYGDVLDLQSLVRATRGQEVAFHCAALMPVSSASEALYTTNVRGTENLLRACVANKVKRLVYLSSIAVYGYRSLLDADENTPLIPNGWYSTSKIKAEQLIRACHREQGLEFVILRPCGIYGVRDNLFLPNLLNCHWWRPVPLADGGRYIIDFVDAAQVATALIAAAIRPRANGRVYHVTDGVSVTFRQFVQIIGDLRGQPLPTLSLPCRMMRLGVSAISAATRVWNNRLALPLNAEAVQAISTHQHFDISRAKKELDYQPPTDFRRGLQRALDWLKSQQSACLHPDSGGGKPHPYTWPISSEHN